MPPISPPHHNETSPLPGNALAVREQDVGMDEDIGDETDLFGRSDDEDDREGLHTGQEAGGEGAHAESAEEPSHEGPHPADGRDPVTLPEPVRPSAEDVERHNITHLPYRNWCEVCTRAVGREDPHKRKRKRKHEDKSELPKISMDYQELISAAKKDPTEHEKVVKAIVVKDELTGILLSYRVSQKGHGDAWLIKRLVQDLEEMGRTSIILKTDGEPAMVSLQRALQSARRHQTVPENPPAYNPQSNGACEKAVQDVAGQIRKLKLALESRLKIEIDEDSNVMQWMIPHAAYLISKFSIGHDGMAPHERLTGRKWSRPLVEFGEVVLAKLTASKTGHGKKKQQKRKLAPRSIRGVFVGQIARTGEHLVIKQNGDAVRCRTIRRVPIEDRWCPEMILNIMGVPRLPAPSQADPESLQASLADDEARAKSARWTRSRRDEVAEKRDAASPASGAGIQQPETRASRDLDIRRMRITDAILEKYGFTDGCPGCQHKREGRPGHRPHTDECRQRLYAKMQANEHDREKLKAEDAKMQIKEEMQHASRMPKSEDSTTATATNVDQNEPMFESVLDSEKLHVIPEEEEPALDADDDAMPHLNVTYDSEDEMEIDAEGDPVHDESGIPELTEDIIVDADTESAGGHSHGEGAQSRNSEDMPSRKREAPKDPGGGKPEDPGEGGKRKRLGRITADVNIEGATATMIENWMREYGHKNDDQKEKHVDGLIQCINAMSKLKQQNDVKEIIQGLENKFDFTLPKNRRQRRTLAMTGKYHVCEAYSPPRMTVMAARHGLKAGWSFDLTNVDPDDGKPWDLSRPEKQAKAMKKLEDDEPMMLVLSPMCGPFSTLQSVFNYPKMQKGEVEDKVRDAMEHVKFCLKLCLEQYRNGRLFLFEHPAGAASWSMKAMQEMKLLDGVQTVKFDFCMLGMRSTNDKGEDAAAQKRTQVMTNSNALAVLLTEAQCRGEHEHAQLLGGRARACQEYPDKFCDLVCQAIKRELSTVKWRDKMNDCYDITKTFGKLLNIQEKLDSLPTPPEEDLLADLYRDSTFVDDMSGRELDKAEAVVARRKELEFFKKLGVYTKVIKQPGMKVISTKWLDVNKGDETDRNYRARLVGREIAHDKRDDLFAATPPLESLRMIVSICSSNQNDINPGNNFIIMSNDVKRAYFYAPATRPIYIYAYLMRTVNQETITRSASSIYLYTGLEMRRKIGQRSSRRSSSRRGSSRESHRPATSFTSQSRSASRSTVTISPPRDLRRA